MTTSARLSRRMVLRGLGTALALPWLEAMAPIGRAARAAGASAPKRMAFFYVPNGAHMPAWTPATEGAGFAMSQTLEPLAAFREDLLVLSGLAQDNGRAKGDGGGDHARSLSSFLTGAHPVKTDGADIRVGISVDQLAAQAIGKATRFPSLELGCDRGAQSGNCDSGYSCAYSSNIAWRSETTPASKEVNPRLVFERLFANHNPTEAGSARLKRDRYRQSILDFVAEDAEALQRKLGSSDQRKLDEYMTAVRELETRLARVETEGSPEVDPGMPRPTGIPEDYLEHVRLMLDMMVLAFQADLTRISTFMYANEGSTKNYPSIGVPEGHHELSHHGGDPKKHAKIQKINQFHIEQFAYFLGRLRAIPEGDGNLLDNSMIVYGSGISDGNRHTHHDLPILLAGQGRGAFKTGRHIRYAEDTPLNNLYLAMLDVMGVPTEVLGDSRGPLPSLTA